MCETVAVLWLEEEIGTLVGGTKLERSILLNLHTYNQARNQGVMGGLDSYPFQQFNKSAPFVVSSLYQKGCFPRMEMAWFRKFSRGFAPSPHFPSLR